MSLHLVKALFTAPVRAGGALVHPLAGSQPLAPAPTGASVTTPGAVVRPGILPPIPPPSTSAAASAATTVAQAAAEKARKKAVGGTLIGKTGPPGTLIGGAPLTRTGQGY